jgi:hypothetical protein
MKLIYVAGPYRAKDRDGIEQNIQKARSAAIKLWQSGWAVITPHMNTAHFDGLADDSVWLEGDLEILRRCDAIYLLKGWESSKGATAEMRLAQTLDIEIIRE